MIKKLLLAAAIAGSLGTVTLPASSAVIIVEKAPPAPREEAVPAPRRGYVWVPGYWDWRGHRHVWVKGTWVRERRGYVYHQPQWVERNGHWEMRRGSWARGDRDGDGVPNGADNHPNNPRRD
ncbi:YXWGXW repeat-containing protein [Oxalobacteraceae bacterium A2-2]